MVPLAWCSGHRVWKARVGPEKSPNAYLKNNFLIYAFYVSLVHNKAEMLPFPVGQLEEIANSFLSNYRTVPMRKNERDNL